MERCLVQDEVKSPDSKKKERKKNMLLICLLFVFLFIKSFYISFIFYFQTANSMMPKCAVDMVRFFGVFLRCKWFSEDHMLLFKRFFGEISTVHRCKRIPSLRPHGNLLLQKAHYKSYTRESSRLCWRVQRQWFLTAASVLVSSLTVLM